MNGISLPINTIVIVAIAVLVLVVISAFFGGWFIFNTLTIERENAMSTACQNWRELYNCEPSAVHSATALHKEPGQADAVAYTVGKLCEVMGLVADGSDGVDPEELEPCFLKCECPFPY